MTIVVGCVIGGSEPKFVPLSTDSQPTWRIGGANQNLIDSVLRNQSAAANVRGAGGQGDSHMSRRLCFLPPPGALLRAGGGRSVASRSEAQAPATGWG